MAFQTAIITGSSRGIGKETAVQLFKMGLNVVICSRNQLDIETTVAEIKEIGIYTNRRSDNENKILGRIL